MILILHNLMKLYGPHLDCPRANRTALNLLVDHGMPEVIKYRARTVGLSVQLQARLHLALVGAFAKAAEELLTENNG